MWVGFPAGAGKFLFISVSKRVKVKVNVKFTLEQTTKGVYSIIIAKKYIS
jgi:hypothetical protein